MGSGCPRLLVLADLPCQRRVSVPSGAAGALGLDDAPGEAADGEELVGADGGVAAVGGVGSSMTSKRQPVCSFQNLVAKERRA